jgi:hypothetical protein
MAFELLFDETDTASNYHKGMIANLKECWLVRTKTWNLIEREDSSQPFKNAMDIKDFSFGIDEFEFQNGFILIHDGLQISHAIQGLKYLFHPDEGVCACDVVDLERALIDHKRIIQAPSKMFILKREL